MHEPARQYHLEGAELLYFEQAFTPQESAGLFEQLAEGSAICWEQPRIRVCGRWVAVPRLTAWYGDPGCSYRYSGRRFEPLPWCAPLPQIKSRVETLAGAGFNGVLLNLYRDGSDSMGWHSDDEPELGDEPTIAAVSFGMPRELQLRPRERARRQGIERIALADGSLLLMRGATQRHWQHRIAKSRRVTEPRINLTFRWIEPRP